MNRLLSSRALAPVGNTEPVTARGVALTASQLHERYLEAVFRYVSRRIAERSEAEDITAEVFAAAFVGLPRFQGELPLAWLLGIARRKIADSLRRATRRKETSASGLNDGDALSARLLERHDVDAATPEQLMQQHEAVRHIHALVNGLPADQREALLLQYVEELSLIEIAVVMHRSSHAVNSLLQRARANLFRAGKGYFLPEPE